MTDELTVLTPNWIAYAAAFAQTLNMQKARDASGLTVNAVKVHHNDSLVQSEIAKNMNQIIDKANVDKAMVLNKLYHFTEADIAEIFYPGTQQYRPLQEWPKELRQQLVSFEICPITGMITKARFIDKLKVIALMGKHVDVGAFEERQRHVHDVSDRLAEKMSAARLRSPVTIEGEVV